MTRISIILFGLTLLTACDCYQRVTGTVVDKATGRPLQGVRVYNKNKTWNETTTDTTGQFELSNIVGGFCCPPMKVIAELKHYDKVEVKIPAGGQEIIKMSLDSLNKWEYFNLTDTIEFKIIAHYLASYECGTYLIPTASLTIGIVENGDTIRVLEFCNTKKDFKPNELVKVIPKKVDPLLVTPGTKTPPRVLIRSSQGHLYENSIIKTTYGILERK